MATIPAITIWQPWATLIMAGCKPYEFRGWPAPKRLHGQRIGIHAGARPVRRAEVIDLIVRLSSDEPWTTALVPEAAVAILERVRTGAAVLPLSSMLGTALLGRPRRASEIVGEFGGPVNDSDRDEHCNWAWPLSAIERFEPPLPAKGMQGFWDWAGPRP